MAKHLDTVLAQAKKLSSSIPSAIDAIQLQIDELRSEQNRLNEFYRAATGSSYIDLPASTGRKPTAKAPKPKAADGGKKRIRRSADELKTIAEQVVSLVAKAKGEGMSAAELKAEVPALAGVQSVKKFIEQYAGKSRVTTKGTKVSMRYFAK